MKTLEQLEPVNTTIGMNGYPKAVLTAYVGFDNADELNDFAEKNNFNIVSLHKRDGWHLWERKFVPFAEDFEISADDYGDDYITFANINEVRNEINFISQELAEATQFDNNEQEIAQLSRRIYNLNIIANKYLQELNNPNLLIITTFSSDYSYVEVSQTNTLLFYYDTHTYTYGVIPNGDEDW